MRVRGHDAVLRGRAEFYRAGGVPPVLPEVLAQTPQRRQEKPQRGPHSGTEPHAVPQSGIRPDGAVELAVPLGFPVMI